MVREQHPGKVNLRGGRVCGRVGDRVGPSRVYKGQTRGVRQGWCELGEKSMFCKQHAEEARQVWEAPGT